MDAKTPDNMAARRKPAENEHQPGLWARLRRYFLAGVLITAPIGITAYLAWIFVDFIDRTVTPLIPGKYNPETYLPFNVPGLGLLVAFVGFVIVGALTRGLIGRWLLHTGERILNQMPVVRGVYAATKQILETILARQSTAFRQAVLVEYPRRGIWAIGFITGTTQGEVQNVTEEETVNVFLPTTPNPTSGFLLFIPRKDLVNLDMPVDAAIKMVISGGIVTPPDLRPASEKAITKVSAATFEDVDVLREKDRTPVLVATAPSSPNEDT